MKKFLMRWWHKRFGCPTRARTLVEEKDVGHLHYRCRCGMHIVKLLYGYKMNEADYTWLDKWETRILNPKAKVYVTVGGET